MTRSPYSLLLFAVLLSAPRALPQDPVSTIDAQLLPLIEQRLDTDLPAQVAWGGYLAQRYRVRSSARALCAALDRWKDREGLEARMVRLHLVDGLLGIGARVPTEQVEFLLGDKMTRAAAMAVMAQDAAANLEGLVRLALSPAEHNEIVRRAAARLLVARGLRSKALGKHVVDSIKFQYVVVVKDSDESSESSEPFGEPFIKYQLIKTKAGYPPLVRIELSTWKDAEAMVKLIVPGRVGGSPIVLTRKEKAVYRRPDMERGRMQAVQPVYELLNLLTHMSGVHVAQQNVYYEIDWTTAEAFLEGYVERRDRLRRRLDRVVAAMRKKEWLGSETPADFRLELKESVSDVRHDTTVALPEIPPAPALGR